MSDFTTTWTDHDDDRLAELRAERRPKSVRLEVARQRELAQRPRSSRTPPVWAGQAVRERQEEAETLRAYQTAPAHVREWLDSHVAARLAGRRFPDMFLDRTLRDVLLAWKAGQLEDDGDPLAAEPLALRDDEHDEDAGVA